MKETPKRISENILYKITEYEDSLGRKGFWYILKFFFTDKGSMSINNIILRQEEMMVCLK